ncbi:four helix bundle protein [soil metagenome]
MTEMRTIQSFRDIRAWQQALAFSIRVMKFSKSLPPEERFALADQLRRAAVSAPSNIAEGYGRGTRIEYRRYLRVARGSLCELHTQLLICRELNYASAQIINDLIAECENCGRTLQALLRSLAAKPKSEHTNNSQS